jgi:hypothetical protein
LPEQSNLTHEEINLKGTQMIYIDYNFDLNDNVIIFDQELKLSSQKNGNKWGNLPETWKEGDMFKLVTGANGKVALLRTKD